MSYGAFVKLEEGIEGLVHISEMSWTRRISHPSELVNVDDEIEVVVLGINKDKQEISLGMKQTQENPWDRVADRYPIGSVVKGTVRNLTNYGAFIEIEEGIDGLLHVSDMSWTRKISHPNEMVEKGQELECRVLSVDQDRRRIALGMKQMADDPWATDIPGKYQPGQIVKGPVTKITNFGVFVGLENGLEGLLHISELADHKVENPEDVVKVGEVIEVKVLRVDADERKIGLSRKRVEWAEEAEAEAGQPERPAALDRRGRAQGRRRRQQRPAVQAVRSRARAEQPKRLTGRIGRSRIGVRRVLSSYRAAASPTRRHGRRIVRRVGRTWLRRLPRATPCTPMAVHCRSVASFPRGEVVLFGTVRTTATFAPVRRIARLVAETPQSASIVVCDWYAHLPLMVSTR